MASSPIVSCRDLMMRYDERKPILRSVSFDLTPGSFRFLTGPSGAGKTTLLRILSLRREYTDGTLKLFGTNVHNLERKDLPFLRRRIGMVFQDYRLLNHLTVAENVALPLKILGEDKIKIARNVRELLTWIGMADHAHAMPLTLSGGQKQRVAIARAVISRPEIILADEPTGNLDSKLSMRVMRLFEALNRQGTTVLVATHDDDMVRRVGYPELRLHHGRVKREPEKREITERRELEIA